MSHILSGLTIALLSTLILLETIPANGTPYHSGGECYQPKRGFVLREFVRL